MRVLTALWCSCVALAACAPSELPAGAPALLVFSLERSAFIELSSDLQAVREVPFAMPDGCGLGAVFPAPRGPLLAIELNCAFGPAVVWLNVDTGEAKQPITTSDSHFLAWGPEGEAVYLRIDSINRPRVIRAETSSQQTTLPISELTYDLAPAPGSEGFLFSFSRGMGLGSEMWYARGGGAVVERIAADAGNYLSLARWSPDGRQIAFIRIPDSTSAFTIGELWIMNADGSGGRLLAEADAGHGFPPSWSPDGTQITFVGRENAEDARADASAEALISNLYVARAEDGGLRRVTDFESARVESPAWEPDGDAIAFAAMVDDRMTVFVKNVISDDLQQVEITSICCASWLRR